jgi:hypothetical protein
MATSGETETGAIPGTVFTPRQVRILKIAVIVMGILLVGGFAFVLAAIVYQASRSAQDGARSAAAGSEGSAPNFDVRAPAGATVTALSLDGNRLAVTLGGADAEIVVIDIGSGRTVARVKLKPE